MDATSAVAATAGALAGAACAALALHGELARMREQLHPSERSVRRIVTANDASGRAVVLADSTAPCGRKQNLAQRGAWTCRCSCC